MHAALKQREQQFRGLRASMMKEKEEEFTLFLEMKKCENQRNDLLLNSFEERKLFALKVPPVIEPDTVLISPQTTPHVEVVNVSTFVPITLAFRPHFQSVM
ncbi:hypothetical protein JHK82_022674 [Glycine max]|nr:hypothetical protein JHK86_022696 [Glycine max]KAG5137943.1 hypothetical protein JHK82_022674 [Glycine max]